MSSRIPDTHAEAWALLPWLANGRIQASDREWVEAHVAGCAECRAELAAQRMMATAMNRDAHLARSGRLPTSNVRSTGCGRASKLPNPPRRPAPLRVRLARRSRSSRTVRWLAAAVVVQGFGLALFGFNALRGPSPGGVSITVTQTFRAARLNAPTVRIVFAPDASIATINTLLAHQGLTIVSGPGHGGQFHRGTVGRCRSLRRIGEFRRRGDFEGSECHFRAAGCTLT